MGLLQKLLKRFNNQFDKEHVKSLNDNFDLMDEKFTNAVEVVSGEAFNLVVGAAKIDWLPPVNTFADLATIYPDAVEGKTSMVRDSGKVYRFNGVAWIEIQDIDPTVINEVDNRLSALAGYAKDKVSNYLLDVKTDFGATGAGVLYDSAPINAALQMAKTGAVKKVFIPDGTYLINSTIDIPRGVQLELSQQAVIKPSTGNFNIFRIRPEATLKGGVVNTKSVNFTAAVFYLNSEEVFQFYEQTHNVSDINVMGKEQTDNWTGTVILVEAMQELTHVNNIKFNNITATNYDKIIHLKTNPLINDPARWVWINACFFSQITAMNFFYGIYIEGGPIGREISGNRFEQCQFQAEAKTKRIVYVEEGSNNLFDITVWDTHKMQSKVAVEFSQGTRWNEVRSGIVQEEFVIVDKGYMNTFLSAADYSQEKSSKFHNVSLPYTPNFNGNQDDALVYGHKRGYTFSSSHVLADGELENLLEVDTGYGATWNVTGATYDNPIRLEIDLSAKPISQMQFLTIVCPDKAFPTDATFSMRDAYTGQWEEVHWVSHNRFQSIIVSPPWASKDLCSGVRIDFFGANQPNNLVHIGRIMAVSSGNDGNAYLAKGGGQMDGDIVFPKNEIGPVLTKNNGQQTKFYVTNYGAMVSRDNPQAGYVSDSPHMFYPMSRLYDPTFVGEQDNFLANAHLRNIAIYQTSSHVVQYGTPELLFNLDNEDSVRWSSSAATEADPITLEVDCRNDDDMAGQRYKYVSFIGVMSTLTNYPKNMIIEAFDSTQAAWRTLLDIRDNKRNVIVVPPWEQVEDLGLIRIKFWGANNAQNQIALCRVFAHSNKTIGRAWFPKTGGRIDGDVFIKGKTVAAGGFEIERRNDDPVDPSWGQIWYRQDIADHLNPLRIRVALGVRSIPFAKLIGLTTIEQAATRGGGTVITANTPTYIECNSLANGNGLVFPLNAGVMELVVGKKYDFYSRVTIQQNVDDRITVHVRNVTKNRLYLTSVVTTPNTKDVFHTLKFSMTLTENENYSAGDVLELQIVQSWLNSTHDNFIFRLYKETFYFA